ncbi:Fc.00g068260.m01.CDS01 [Cosmosporella sp. VM-42]
MPALTITTDHPRKSRSPSPSRPPVSPITPTLGPARLASGATASDKRTLTHSQPDQTGIPPPPPEPLAFDANPDVIALKSAISILQIQRQKATADIQALSRAKDAAVGDPEAFIKDLASGKINAPQPDSDSEDDDEEMGGLDNAGEGSSKQRAQDEPREWTTLPKPQDVVRCPPINWSQYAIVGDSLDKLHTEQVTRPTQGTPASIGVNGMYEFKGEGKQERYMGVAAPYNPLQDKVEKKGKGKK